MLKDVLKKRTFVPTTDLKKAVKGSDVSFIGVGTPCGDDGSIDLTQIRDATRQIGYALKDKVDYHVVVVKSTVVPGTTEGVVLPILEKVSGKRAGVDFGVCMNPEFLREGRAVNDFMFPKGAGIVIGEFDQKSGDLISKIYEEFDGEILRTSIRAAEMIKYARNSYLAKDVSFANEIANICHRLGVDYLDVKKGMEMDARIGEGRFLDAGAGFGGSCFPKDVSAIVAKAKESGIAPIMLESTLKINEAQPYQLVELTKQVVGNPLKGKRIAVLGLAFKPGTDDVRESRSLVMIDGLLAAKAKVQVHDPMVMGNVPGTVVCCNDKYDAVAGADALVLMTEWDEYGEPDWDKVKKLMRGRALFDGRNRWDPAEMRRLGFDYYGVGRRKQ